MFRAEGGDKVFLQNGGTFLLGYTASITEDCNPPKDVVITETSKF
jgi:hypothetical protein